MRICFFPRKIAAEDSATSSCVRCERAALFEVTTTSGVTGRHVGPTAARVRRERRGPPRGPPRGNPRTHPRRVRGRQRHRGRPLQLPRGHRPQLALQRHANRVRVRPGGALLRLSVPRDGNEPHHTRQTSPHGDQGRRARRPASRRGRAGQAEAPADALQERRQARQGGASGGIERAQLRAGVRDVRRHAQRHVLPRTLDHGRRLAQVSRPAHRLRPRRRRRVRDGQKSPRRETRPAAQPNHGPADDTVPHVQRRRHRRADGALRGRRARGLPLRRRSGAFNRPDVRVVAPSEPMRRHPRTAGASPEQSPHVLAERVPPLLHRPRPRARRVIGHRRAGRVGVLGRARQARGPRVPAHGTRTRDHGEGAKGSRRGVGLRRRRTGRSLERDPRHDGRGDDGRRRARGAAADHDDEDGGEEPGRRRGCPRRAAVGPGHRVRPRLADASAVLGVEAAAGGWRRRGADGGTGEALRRGEGGGG